VHRRACPSAPIRCLRRSNGVGEHAGMEVDVVLAGATMTYHSLPITDHFRRVSDTILIGALEAPGQERPGYFYLTKLAAPAPQRTAPAALTHTTNRPHPSSIERRLEIDELGASRKSVVNSGSNRVYVTSFAGAYGGAPDRGGDLSVHRRGGFNPSVGGRRGCDAGGAGRTRRGVALCD
jgi:hypothetical protein